MPRTGALTKARIIEAVAEANGFTRNKSIETVEAVIELLKHALESGEDVLISGFGKFCVKQKAKRKDQPDAALTLPFKIKYLSTCGLSESRFLYSPFTAA